MEAKGSFLLGALGKSFKDILRGALDSEQAVEQVQPASDKPSDKVKKKKVALKPPSKDEKGSKEKTEKESKEAEVTERKFLPRDGNTSLITYSNASNFAVFSHVRNFVLQNQLCEMFNSRFAKSDVNEAEEDESEEEAKKRKQHGLSKVVSMGVRGVFEIIRETWHTHPGLCVKALQSFLDLLQGQAPSGLKYEPKEITDVLYELLSQMVSEESGSHDSDSVSSQLSSVACACLLSLVVGLGDTSKMLSAISMMLIGSSQLSTTIQVPQIFLSLQKSVQAVLLKGIREVNWSEHGVQSSSKVDSWKIEDLVLTSGGQSAIASDGQWLYVHCAAGLLKLGSGYAGTKKGSVYQVDKDFYPNDTGWLGYGNGKLYFFKHGLESDTIQVIDPKTLKVENELLLPDDCLGSQALFVAGEKLGQIRATKEGGFLIREFTTIASPLITTEEKPLNLAQRNLLCMGKAKYDQQEHLHTLYATNANTVERVVASRTFAVVQTTQGKLYYTGNGEAFGITEGKETKAGEWAEVPPLPDNDSKIIHCTCDTNGTYFIVVCENETVYFSGTNKKGESGEAPGNNPKPTQFKKIGKMKDACIVSASCGNHTTALLNKEGQLYMFGDLPISGVTDEGTGVVTALLGIPVSQVMLGHSHTCVLTQLGTVYTFGGNNYGQCGRDYQPPEDEKKQDMPADESSSSEEEEEEVVVRAHAEIMCPGGAHSWSRGECRVCSVCGYCTGYGPNCVNTDKYLDPGTACGCGAGDAGCEDCGCCKVCSGELDPHEMINHDNSIDDDIEYIYEDGREDVKARMEANEIEIKRKVKRKKKKVKKEDKKKDKDALAKDPNYLPVPLEVHFPGDMTAMQIECGTFHTVVLLHSGEVFTFGNNNHGQLGLGHNKPCGEPSKVDLPGPASQIACGDNHTVVLLVSGEIYTFGKHKEGQLGRCKDNDDELWHAKPAAMASVGDASGLRKASWISARGNQTFVNVHESLLSETSVSRCSIFANSDVIGILPPEKDMYLVVLDYSSTTAKRFDTSDQAELHDKAFCIDPIYNVLWTHSVSDQLVCCYNPIAAGMQDTDPAGTILSPSLVLPSAPSCGPISRQLAALNLLSCINTLASCSEMSLDMVLLPGGSKPNPDDFSSINRFDKFSGSWGYGSAASPTHECIRFNASQEVLLGGIGLFAGRGEYKADITIYDIGKSGGDTEPTGKLTVLVQHKEDTYKTAAKEIKKVFFSKPVALKPSFWYLIKVCIHGPSSDAGGDGKQTITGEDGVKFSFKESKMTNNGTNVRSGQIPLIVYRLASGEGDKETEVVDDKKEGASVHMIKKDFAGSVSEVGIQAVLKLLDWSWHLFSDSGVVGGSGMDISNTTFIATTCVNLLRIYITYAYPIQGVYRPSFDNPVMAQSIHEVHCLMKRILSSHHSSSSGGSRSPAKHVIDACHVMFRECFHVFYPSGVLKWYAACRFLERLDPHDVYSGIPGEKLLSAVLDALSDSTTSYIGLNYDNTVRLSDVLQNTEPEKRYPVLSEFMHMKALEGEGDRELLSFETVASKLLSVVTVPLLASLSRSHGDKLPVSSVVESSGKFLVSRMTELALAASHSEAATLSSLSVEENSRSCVQYQLPLHFSGHCNDLPQIDVTDLLFSVDKPVLLHSLNLFGQPDGEYNYTVYVAKEGEGAPLAGCEGNATANRDGTINVQFTQAIEIASGGVYRVQVLLGAVNEPSYRMGEGGQEVVSTAEGVVFTFHDSEQEYCDYRTSVVASFVYSFGHDASNPVELSIALTALFLETFVNFLEQLLSVDSPAGLIEQAGNSFLLTTLLPVSLAHLAPIVCYHPKYIIKVLTLMKRVIPLVCAVNQKMSDAATTTTHMNGMHYALVETDHPYKAPGVNLFKVKFVEEVQWMSLEFDSRSGFAQQWDKMDNFVLSNVSQSAIANKTDSKTKEPSTITIDKSDIHYNWGDGQIEIPNGLVLLPGNEVNIRVVMDTEYEKHEDANHYGIRCQAVGYEWGTANKEVFKVLEKELVNLSAMLASFLLKENTKLPWIEELPVDASYGSSFTPADIVPSGDPEKADMRIVESAAKDVLVHHPQLLGRGIVAAVPSVSQVLLKDMPAKKLTNEQMFLKDFISCSNDTAGARMAKWLQPDRSVDMQASELVVPAEGATCWENITCFAQTRDHDGTRVYVPHMKVEIKLLWLRPDPEAVPMEFSFIECVTGVYKPCCEKSFFPTRVGTNYQFHSVSAMMAYCDYSFEELRLFSPRGSNNPDYMMIENQENGNYNAHWVPTVPGVYSVQLYVDGRHTGQSKELVVKEKPPPEDEEDETMADEEKEKTSEGDQDKAVKEEEEPKAEEKPQPELLLASAPKMKAKRFYGRDSSGLRVRAQPSLLSNMIGLLKPGDLVNYTEEVTDEAGCWIKLTEESLAKYCEKPTGEGYALSYSVAAKKTLLEDEEVPVAVPAFVQQKLAEAASAPPPQAKHKRPRNKKRMGGSGEYEVVHCGSAGHNIRSQPNMNGTPVGRLSLDNTFTASEEIENKDGIWLRLSEADTKKYCSGDSKSDVWTMACASSGRLFIRMIGDDYEFGVPTITAPTSQTTVSQQLFSVPKAAAVFPTTGSVDKSVSTPVKLNFGQEKPAPSSSSGSATASEKDDKKDSKEAKDMKGKKLQKQASLARRRATAKKAASLVRQDAELEETATTKSSSSLESVKIIQALSPAVAECQRAVYAAFLWHQGLVHDAMASSFHLKLHPSLSKEMINQSSKDSNVAEKKEISDIKEDEVKVDEESNDNKLEDDKKEKDKKEDGGVADEDKEPTEEKSIVKDDSKRSSKDGGPVLPPTLSHLVTFWEEISAKVLEISNEPLRPPKIPSIVRELQKEFEEHKKSEDKKKKEAKKPLDKSQQQGPALCELCDGHYSDPVTYHMKEAHPGCGKHAGGFGYNSRGSFCSGWAGNCGDGGKGGSTWYLMCKDCHEKYLAEKTSVKKAARPVLVSVAKAVQQPGKPRVLQTLPSIQGLIQNSQFLLEVNGMSDSSLLSGKHSDMMQHPIASTSSAISPTELQKAESLDTDMAMKLSEPSMPRPKFLRSVSMWPEGGKVRTDEVDRSPSFIRRHQYAITPEDTEMVFDRPSLVERPSMALARLVYKRSRHEDKEDPCAPIVAFIVNRHDLDGLRVAMRQTMCIAAIKSHALEVLQWLLHMVKDTGAVHDTLWQFVTTICAHPMDERLTKVKDKEKEKDKSKMAEGTDSESLGKHPLLGLDGAGAALVKLRKQFHCFLQTVSELMPKLPMGSAVQQMAMKCWCLQFQPEDQSFLIQSNVFANISTVLSNVEEVSETTDKKLKPSQPPSEKATEVWLMQDVLAEGRLKPSSNDAMANSLTDVSTETFWESRDEPRSKAKALMVTFNNEKKLYAAAIHNDNGKDSGQRITEMSLLIGPDEANLKKVDECNISTTHSGWTILLAPAETSCQVVRIEMKGSSNNVRVRQLQILAVGNANQEMCMSASAAQQRSCEVEALQIFRLLTSQVFGSLLSTKADAKVEDETDSGEKEEKDLQSSETDLHEQLGSLFGKDQLNRMQKRVCEHIIRSIHSEAERMKEDWKNKLKLSKQVKPDEQDKPHDSDDNQAQSSPDTYCFELVSMVMGLCQSQVGRSFLAEQGELIRDLLVLLHVSTTRIQLQVVALLEKVIPDITPRKLADHLDIAMLPPEGYSAIAAAISSGTAVLNHVGLLDIFIACVSKALSVQAKAKGRSAGLLQDIGGGPRGPGITLVSLLASEKTVSVEADVKDKRWWLKGSMSVEVATEIIKFLGNMTKGEYGSTWSEIAKAAIGQTVLHLTKLTEDSRVPIPGMYSQTLWLCLGALCVIDEHHAEVLSSGQWMGQDGKPRTKPLCDNHDDGATQALILCDVCGNLCGDCDRILHLPKKMKSHQRQVFKEEEEAVKVDLHEGCGRIKLYWAMVLADCRTLKGLVEFRETTSGTGGGQCRFCGSTVNTGLLAIGTVCAEMDCQERAKVVCTKTLACGHPCNGVQGEEVCLPCLSGCKIEAADGKDDVKSKLRHLKQDADDMCMICYTENLSCGPCIQLDCGHVFHYHCCDLALTKKWSGPRISFRFMFCSLCQNVPVAHPKLKTVLDPVIALYDDVKRKCLLRLEYENKAKCEALTTKSSKFYQLPFEYAMSIYCYYVCFKCKKSYYGGEARCIEQAGLSDEFDPSELVCGGCSDVAQAQVCAKHGTDFLEYKCRYCCSVAVYFCFGTTHFCNSCHNDFQRLTGMKKSEFPQCPVAPRAKPMEGNECPLHVKHPPTGEEFALGCGVCRNAQTF